MTSIVRDAMLFAHAAHAAIGQKRKYTDESYINHPAAVVQILHHIDAPDEVKAAGWMHDVAEDTGVTLEDIRLLFGPVIAALVGEVTDVSRPEDGNRAMRKEIDRLHLSQASYWGKTIKLADLIDNTSSITQHDPHFAKVYMGEKARLMEVLQNGHPGLYRKAMAILQEYQQAQVQRALSPYAA